MNDIDRRTLAACLQYFRNNWYSKDPGLLEQCEFTGLITKSMAENVKAQKGSNQVTELFEALAHCGPRALSDFIDLLKKNEPHWIAQELVNTRKRVGNEVKLQNEEQSRNETKSRNEAKSRKNEQAKEYVDTRNSLIKQCVDRLIKSFLEKYNLEKKQELREKLIGNIKGILEKEISEFSLAGSQDYQREISDIHSQISPYLTDSQKVIHENNATLSGLKQEIDALTKRIIKLENKGIETKPLLRIETPRTELEAFKLTSKYEHLQEENRKLKERIRNLEAEKRKNQPEIIKKDHKSQTIQNGCCETAQITPNPKKKNNYVSAPYTHLLSSKGKSV